MISVNAQIILYFPCFLNKKPIDSKRMTHNFFEHHGYIVLICLALFPRLTLLIGSFATGGLLWWLGFIFTPHLLVAFLSLPYWETNPFLVIVAWVMALIGTVFEGKCANSKK